MPNAEYRVDMDEGFLLLDSRTNASLLKPQQLQYCENIRIERGEARRRLGYERLDDGAIQEVGIDPETGVETAVITPIFGSGLHVTQEGVESIVMVASSRIIVYTPSEGTFLDYTYPTGRTIPEGTNVAVVQALDKVYIHRGMPEKVKDCTINNDFGFFDTVNVYCLDHDYEVGDEIIVSSLDPASPIESFFTGSFLVTNVIDTNNFEYFVDVQTAGFTREAVVQRARTALVWDGNTISLMPQGNNIGMSANMPPTDTSIYYGNRMIVRTDRNSIALSDYLDFNTFDLTFGQFTINQGANDKILSITPWMDDEFLVFQRNSVYVGKAINTAYEIGAGIEDTSYLKTVTNSFGVLAPKGIINTGRYVAFLSDSGIYLIEPQLDLKLLNTIEPISTPIENYYLQIRKDLAEKSVSAYFENRLYFAVPIGPEATGNNRILVYNVLNKGWESIDSFSSGMNIIDFIVCIKDDRKRLFAITDLGVYLCEELNSGDESLEYNALRLPFILSKSLAGTGKAYYNITSKLISRKYTMKTSQEKRFSGISLDLKFEDEGALRTTLNIYNPDQFNVLIDEKTSSVPKDFTRRVPIARRGYAAEVVVETITGRPIFRGMSIDATTTSRSHKSTE